jgi:hypothetical protein
MKMRKMTVVSAVMFIGLGAQAVAADIEFQSDNGPPIRFHNSTPLVVIHQGTNPIPLKDGKTTLDVLRKVFCKSVTGCVITARVWVTFDSAYCSTLSAYVDNVRINPPDECRLGSNGYVQQSTIVSMGRHTIQSAMGSPGDGEVHGWEAEYTVYESSVPAN